MPNEQLNPKLLSVINVAVERAVAATRTAQATEAKDIYKQTERRLYAYPHLLEKVQDDIARLTDLEAGITQDHSISIVRFSPSGVRADPEEMYEALLCDMRARLARDQQEVETIQKALRGIERDAYFAAVPARYFDGRADWEVAEELHCDESTVRRNRSRLVRIVSIRLFGSIAV